MDCPSCKYPDMRVIKSRQMNGDGIRRRRECQHCKFRITTEEHLKVYKRKKEVTNVSPVL